MEFAQEQCNERKGKLQFKIASFLMHDTLVYFVAAVLSKGKKEDDFFLCISFSYTALLFFQWTSIISFERIPHHEKRWNFIDSYQLFPAYRQQTCPTCLYFMSLIHLRNNEACRSHLLWTRLHLENRAPHRIFIRTNSFLVRKTDRILIWMQTIYSTENRVLYIGNLF